MDHSAILSLPGSERISVLKEKMLDEPPYRLLCNEYPAAKD